MVSASSLTAFVVGAVSLFYGFTTYTRKMNGLEFDKEFWDVAGPLIAVRPPLPPSNALELRARVNTGLAAIIKAPFPENVVEVKHEITSFDGERIAVYQFVLSGSDADKSRPAFVYVHGGGTVGGQIDPYQRLIVAMTAAATGVQMFAVEYRLAPEFPYPTPAEDCYAVLQWLSQSADSLSVDPSRIGLYALSGGGTIALGASMMARDRGLSPPLAKQILIYPMLDDRTRVLPDNPLSEFLTWTDKSNQIGWNAYLGGKAGEPGVPGHAAPARADNVSGLPSTYIDVGSLDIFCAESVAFANRLVSANVQTELHVYPGVPHIFDLYAPNIEITKVAKQNQLRAARSL
ncbi:Carboxylesterase NlhH 1 [Colletotrichum chlorophyti]|uniref:Carboxylesterase NlhH 1 n=1 Tax=Colletotrichum chlorophyti TaxID=708187 RepID=A0A1Q8RSL7_9PEZI|nr:Carboxylesterase NlhH 1 [Colletotrichum chlorophyti]